MAHYRATRDLFVSSPGQALATAGKAFALVVDFIAQVSACYPKDCAGFAAELMQLLDKHASVLDPMLRRSLVQSLILLRNRKMVEAHDLLPLLFTLFRCNDKLLRRTVFSHIVTDLARCNAKHRDERLNRRVQNFLYRIVAEDNEMAAKKSMCVLAQMYHKRVWTDANTVNVVASAVFHKSPRITVAALKFFMGHDDVDSDADSDDEGDVAHAAAASGNFASKEDIYRAFNKGTRATKRKKQQKLRRARAAMKKIQRGAQDGGRQSSFTAIQMLRDPQAFGERLFSKLLRSSDRWETKLMMMHVISRVIGVHQVRPHRTHTLLFPFPSPSLPAPYVCACPPACLRWSDWLPTFLPSSFPLTPFPLPFPFPFSFFFSQFFLSLSFILPLSVCVRSLFSCLC